MATKALYDAETNAVIQIKDDNPPPGQQANMFTGSPPSPGAKPKWYDFIYEMPIGYNPAYPQLLGPWVAQLRQDNKLYAIYPSADYSPEAIRGLLGRWLNARANLALSATDWYHIRKLDTGQDIPQDVLDERAAIRQYVSDLADRLASTLAEEVADFLLEIPLDIRAEVAQRQSWVVPGTAGKTPPININSVTP